jgi:NADPH:quinone reductase-like Zn-dependent oxidoreductase
MSAIESQTTAAVAATAPGGPEVLSVVEVPVAAPRPHQVRIAVRAAGTNPVDYKQYSGLFGRDPAMFPMRLGREAAGVVTAVGDDAVGPQGRLHVGDEVAAFPIEGAYAADIVVPASSVIRKPPALSFEPASGLLLVGATAVHALHVIEADSGDTVLIHGGAGGVGIMVIQLATAAGARVIATASETSHPLVRELGADPVTYGAGLLERVRALAPQGIDAAIDAVGTDEAIDTSVALVSNRERIVTMAAARRGLELGLKVIGGAPGADPGTEIRAAARLDLMEAVGAGKLRVIVADTFAMSDVADAHRALAAGHTHGKIILLPTPLR